MEGYIYLMTDTTNGKQYAGQHHYDKEELDPNYHGSGRIITNIYKKRPETIEEEYLRTCYSQEELDEWEDYYIDKYDTLYPNGYNLKEGGSHGKPSEETRRRLSEAHKGKVSSNKGVKMSDTQKYKISSTLKGKYCGENHPFFGRHHSEEAKRKMSKNHFDCSGENHPFFGRHHSEEAKRKMSGAKMGKYNNKSSKPVLQYTLSGEFVQEWPSTMEADRCGYNFKCISDCCRGEQKTHKGYIWKYKE